MIAMISANLIALKCLRNKHKTPKEKLIEELGNLPRLSFSYEPARSPEESCEPNVLWGVKSLREVLWEADRRFRSNKHR